jgi:catechol 2,3-dioxygenase-like lactoylglutathione lyase family enzyme
MASVTGLAGILIWTDNFEPMCAFYRDTLGLAPRHVKPGFVNFDWNGIRLTISEHADVHGQNTDPLRLMVNFTVDDIHAVHQRLTSSGVEFLRTPGREPFGLVATLRDPDGNTLQLFQFD